MELISTMPDKNTPRETWALMHAADLEQNNSCKAAAGDNGPESGCTALTDCLGLMGQWWLT